MNPSDKIGYSLDTAVSNAFREIHEGSWDFNIFSIEVELTLDRSVDDVFDFFASKLPKYRVWYGRAAYLYSDSLSVHLTGDLGQITKSKKSRFDDAIMISGRREDVIALRDEFFAAFKHNIIENYFSVDWISMGSTGLNCTSMPVKSQQKFYNEMYPIIPDVDQYIEDFVNSSSNVLILTGPPGLGKSAFINHLILKAHLKTQVVYDTNIMKMDDLYSNFIQRTMRDDGGMMVLEDSDLILESREFSKNETMSKLLNISEGVIDTSRAKFIFTANLNSVNDVDEALTRPGRCYDVLEFRYLTREEAEIAAAAIGVELVGDKDSYSVAEVFNGKTQNNNAKLRKVGFI